METVNTQTGEIMPVVSTDSDLITASDRAAIDTQIATAKMYPRSLTDFKRKATELATQDRETAQACIYSLPRGGKAIVGPNVRFAEILATCWGNIRVKARATHCDGQFAYAEAVAWDLESNTAIQADGRQPVYGKWDKQHPGTRLPPDQDTIANAMGAASSKALRNAIFKVVPQAVFRSVYLRVLEIVGGSKGTLVERREKMLAYWASQGVSAEQVCNTLSVRGTADIGIEQIVVSAGIYQAVKDGIMTLERAFPPVLNAAEKLEAGKVGFGKKGSDEKDAAQEAPEAAPEPSEPTEPAEPTFVPAVGQFVQKGKRGQPMRVLCVDPPQYVSAKGRVFNPDGWPEKLQAFTGDIPVGFASAEPAPSPEPEPPPEPQPEPGSEPADLPGKQAEEPSVPESVPPVESEPLAEPADAQVAESAPSDHSDAVDLSNLGGSDDVEKWL